MAKYTFERPKGRVVLVANDKGEAVCADNFDNPPNDGLRVEVYVQDRGAQVGIHHKHGTIVGEASSIDKLYDLVNDALVAVCKVMNGQEEE